MSKEDTSWVDETLGFWFGELGPDDWFAGGADLDGKVRQRLGPLLERIKPGFDPRKVDDPRTALAAVILFDQAPRNIHRGTAAAFACDDDAVTLARLAVDKGLDAGLSPDERQFLYMPFMHSEVVADQERCVDLFRNLDNEEGLKYAIDHRDIIVAYGRFPHRNAVLERESTPQEVEFLKTHPGYGQ